MRNLSRWFAVLLPVLILALALAPEVQARVSNITCKSLDHQYNYCRAKTEGQVSSRFVDGRIVAGETVFQVVASQDGFRATQAGVPDNVVYYRRIR